MMKKCIAMLLVLTMVFALVIPAGAVDSFPDLEGHWAKANMLDLVNRGLLKGDSNGKMNPDKATTTLESLVMLSRFYDLDADQMAWVKAEQADYVENNIDPALTWGYEAIEICLAAGIVKEGDMSKLKLTSPISKELLSIFLVRALQMVDDAKSHSGKLKFNDADTIIASYRPYVGVLADNGIVGGDTNNNFTPKLAVTRAVVSTMLSRSLKLLEDKDITLELEGYEPAAQYQGRLEKVAGSTILVRDSAGVVFQYTVASDAKITENKKTASLGSTQYGYPIALTLEKGVVVGANVDKESGATWAQGLMTSNSTGYLYYTPLGSSDSEKVTLANDVKVYYNNAAVELGSLARNTMVTLKMENSKVTAIYGAHADYEMTGTIDSISVGATVEIKVVDDKGTVFVFAMPIAKMPVIYRGSQQISVEQLVVGDEVTMNVKVGTLATIVTTAAEGDMAGEIIGISTTADGTTWSVKDTAGNVKTMALEKGATAYEDGKAISISSFAIGDVVAVTVYKDRITSVTRISSSSDTKKVTATVLVADSAAKKITVQLSGGSLVYINTNKAGAVILASTGKSYSLSSMDEGDRLVAYGTYTDSNTFQASAVIIED